MVEGQRDKHEREPIPGKRMDIMGNIGVGKTHLAGLISQRLRFEVSHERFDQNPYLEDYYQDPQTWGFHSQIWCLINKAEQLAEDMEKVNGGINICSDQSIYMDYVFAWNAHRLGYITETDWETYKNGFEVITSFLPRPDLIIVLKADVSICQERITGRGREYEQDISPEYLKRLGETLDLWLKQNPIEVPILIIETDGLNLVNSETDKSSVFEIIGQSLEA